MSRWHDLYKSYLQQWSQLTSITKELVSPDSTVVTNVEEIARLKKAIGFISGLLEGSDPELIPTSAWSSFQDQTNQCISQITAYKQNSDIGHIQAANNNADNLLTYIRPYMVNGKSAAIAAGRALNDYTDTVHAHINQLNSQAKSALESTKKYQEEAAVLYQAIQDEKTKIDNLAGWLFEGDSNEDALEDRVKDLFTSIENWHKKIEEYHQKLTSGNEAESAIILQIEDAKGKAQKNARETNDAVSAIQTHLGQLGDFYTKVFGKVKEDGSEEREGGLEKEIEKRRADLTAFKAQQEKTYETLLKEIEGLLPGATSAGLGAAYGKLKRSFIWPIIAYTGVFCLSLTALVVFSFVASTESIGKDGIKFITYKDWPEFGRHVLQSLPIIGPLLWLTLFASSRRSEAQRLQQEYAHKEALAKSYENFKAQIILLGREDDELLVKLLDTTIDAIAFNASSTLDKKHGDKMPLQGILEEALDKADPVLEKVNQLIDKIRPNR